MRAQGAVDPAETPELFPLLSESSGELVASGLQLPGSDTILFFGSQTDSAGDLVVYSGENRKLVSLVVPSSRYDHSRKLTVAYGFPSEPVKAGIQPTPLAEGWNLCHYSDNAGTSLPKLVTTEIELTDAQAERLTHFPTKISITGGYDERRQCLGGLLFQGATPVAYVGHHGSTEITAFPLKTLYEILPPIEQTNFRKNLYRAMLGQLEWPEGKPTLESPIKPLTFRLKQAAILQPVKVAINMSGNRPNEAEQTLKATITKNDICQCMIDLTEPLQTAHGIYASITAGQISIAGTMLNDLIETTKGPLRISDLPLHLEWQHHYNRRSFPARDFPELLAISTENDEETLIKWADVEELSVHKLEQFLDYKIVVTIDPDHPASIYRKDNLHLDLALSPEGSIRHQGTTKRSLRFTDYTIKRELPNRKVIYTANGKYLITLTDEDIEVIDRKTLQTVSRIRTGRDQATASTYTCDSSFLYLLDFDQQMILSYALPSGQFHGRITRSDLALTPEDKIHKIKAHRLATDECVLLVETSKSIKAKILRIDTRTKKVIAERELFWGISHYLHTDFYLRSPLFAKVGSNYPLFPSENGLKDMDWNNLPLAPSNINSSNDELRYQKQRIRISELESNFPEFRWVSAQDCHPYIKYQSLPQAEQREAKTETSNESMIFAQEPSYFRAAPNQILNQAIPIYATNPPLSFEIIAGPPEYTINSQGQLMTSKPLESSPRPDFILIQVEDSTSRRISFWTAIDHR